MLTDNERDVIRRGELMDHSQPYLKRLCQNARLHVTGNKAQLAKRLYECLGITQHDLVPRPFVPPQPVRQNLATPPATAPRPVVNPPPTITTTNQNKIEDISSLYYDGKQKEQALVDEVHSKKRSWAEAALNVASMMDNDQLDGIMEHATKLVEMVDVIKKKEDQQKKNRAWIELMSKVVPPTMTVASGCCPICTENYDAGQRREAVFGQCGHCLCKQCGDQVMTDQRRQGKATHCPLCRTRCDRLVVIFRS